MNSKELSALTGISDRTLRDWQSKGIVPKSDADVLPLADYIKAIVSHLKAQAEEAKAKDTEDGELYQEKVRLTRAQADKVELEIAVRQGELIEAVAASAEWSKLVAAFRARMLSLPSKTAPQVVDLDDPTLIEQLLRDIVYEALDELAGYRADGQNSTE